MQICIKFIKIMKKNISLIYSKYISNKKILIHVNKLKYIFPKHKYYLPILITIILLCITSGTFIWMTPKNNIKQEINKAQQTYLSFEINNKNVADIQKIEYAPERTCFIGGKCISDINQTIITDSTLWSNDVADAAWLENTIIPEICKNNEKYDMLAFNIGINDIEDVNKCAELLNNISKKYSNKYYFYINTGPVNEQVEGLKHNNTEIQRYNTEIVSKLNSNWKIIDLFSYMSSEQINQNNYDSKNLPIIFAWMNNNIKNQELNQTK